MLVHAFVVRASRRELFGGKAGEVQEFLFVELGCDDLGGSIVIDEKHGHVRRHLFVKLEEGAGWMIYGGLEMLSGVFANG